MKHAALIAALLGAATASAAEAPAPTPKDFAHGMNIALASAAPVQQFTVPEGIYQGVARADLGDLRVFNGAGTVVPHALCLAPPAVAPSVRELGLLVYPLRLALPGSAAVAPNSGRVTVRTQGGTSVQVIEGGAPSGALTPGTPATATAPEGFVVDATAAPGALRVLRLAWSTPDGASEAQVRVEASEDLNTWRTIVASTTLLHVAADGRTLDRNHIDLPEARYRYLRLVRNSGPAVTIGTVTADVVTPGTVAEPFWFAAAPAPDGGDGAFLFDAGRLAPVQAAFIELPMPNMSVRAALDSRGSPEQPWQTRWTGDVASADLAGGSAIASAGIALPRPASAQFGPVTDRAWRVRIVRGRESLGSAQPVLRLGYHPARLRFLAQGQPPYTVAFGSVRVPPAELLACNALMPTGGESLIGAAQVSAAPAAAFGGDEMLAPPPKPTPLRQIVLWAVLLLGAAALVAMALALLRRLRDAGGTAPPVAMLIAALLLAGCAAPTGDPQATADAFQQALQSGDGERAKSLLAPDVLIYEFGGQEASVTEYAASHLGADMKYLSGATIQRLDRRVQVDGALAVVTTRSRVKGAYQDKPFDQLSTETLVLRHDGAQWRIAHIHWSSRAAPKDAAPGG